MGGMTNLLNDFIDSSEIAKLLRVSPSAVSNWKKRHKDFPQPALIIGGHQFYNREAILEWDRNRVRKTHGGKRVPQLTNVLKIARRMSKEDQKRLKELL